jgi:hypothetical protein
MKRETLLSPKTTLTGAGIAFLTGISVIATSSGIAGGLIGAMFCVSSFVVVLIECIASLREDWIIIYDYSTRGYNCPDQMITGLNSREHCIARFNEMYTTKDTEVTFAKAYAYCPKTKAQINLLGISR